MKKHALLVQAHQDIGYFLALAKCQPDVNIYVHIDAKSTYMPAANDLQAMNNITILTDRVTVHWGGFSQVEASLRLFDAALANDDNAFFHLISGEDVLLQSFDSIAHTWQQAYEYKLMMTSELAPQYAYRLMMNSLHADKHWQRNLSGKLLTKFQQVAAKIVPYKWPVYFGSQWFSVTRKDWSKIRPLVLSYQDFFRKKLVPDEHFFQTLIHDPSCRQTQSIDISNDNKRFIVFDKQVNRGNSPIYLDISKLAQAHRAGFWFARKVKPAVAIAWLTRENQ